LTPIRTAVDVCILVSQGAGRGDAGWKQMWTSHEWGDHERLRGLFLFLFLFLFLYHIFVVTVQEIAWSASYGENKTQKPKRTNKGKNHHQALHLGSIPVPGPHTGTKLKKGTSKESLL